MTKLRLHVLTIALDSMPWIGCIFSELNRLRGVDWTWHVVEGAAMNQHCSSWMAAQPPRLSGDGTSEFIFSIAHHPRVKIYRKPRWEGKVEMVNAPLAGITSECVLLQCDSDELHTAAQLAKIVGLFEADDQLAGARFACRYFVGPALQVVGNDCYGANPGEWLRAWRFQSGMRFDKHEPPVLAGNRGRFLSREETRANGLVFDHYAWATEKQCLLKQGLYGRAYASAPAGWRKLQTVTQFPVRLKDYFPWVDERAVVVQL